MNYSLIFGIIGLSLILMEYAVPGVYLSSFGIGSIIASFCHYLDYSNFDVLIAFIVSSTGAALISRHFYGKLLPVRRDPEALIGKKVKAAESFKKGKGKIKKGDKVEITGKKDMKFKVKKV